MEKITTFTGVAVPLRRSNVDTDQIIPAVYLKRVTKTGYEDALFSSWRQDPEFILNDPVYAGAAVLFCALGIAFTWRVERARVLRYVFAVYLAAMIVAYLVPSFSTQFSGVTGTTSACA